MAQRRPSYASMLSGTANSNSESTSNNAAGNTSNVRSENVPTLMSVSASGDLPRSGFMAHMAANNPLSASASASRATLASTNANSSTIAASTRPGAHHPRTSPHHLQSHSTPFEEYTEEGNTAGSDQVFQLPRVTDQSSRWPARSLPSAVPGESGFGILLSGLFTGVMDQARSRESFIPTYLRGSKYAEQLREKREARRQQRQQQLQQQTAQSQPRDGRSGRSSLAGSLSTSASNLSLHKMPAASHYRGVTQDVVERSIGLSDEGTHDLPSRWSALDKSTGIDITDGGEGLEIKYSGTTKGVDDAATIRTDCPIPKECGIYYFEVTIEGRGKESLVAVGICSQRASLNRFPGWESQSWGYHGDDGNCFAQKPSGSKYSEPYGAGDVVGCGVDMRNSTCFFTKNGHHIGVAFSDIQTSISLYPCVGMKKTGDQLKVNFGQSEFVYDIVGHISREKQNLRNQIASQDCKELSEGRTEPDFLRDLVAQYLAHEGFIETSREFTQQCHRNARILRPTETTTPAINYKEDQDAVERQRIRNAILDGDIDKAIKHTEAYYPGVLQNHENVYFKLRCRKFVEMIRRCDDFFHTLKESRGSFAKPVRNGRRESREEGIFEDGMELDGHDSEHVIVGDDMDTDGHDDTHGNGVRLGSVSMQDCLAYGQELQSEFKSDPRREVKQALEDTFALIAYPDARESSLAPLLKTEGRIQVAEELNSAILVSIGKSSSAALERLCQQTEVLLRDLGAQGHGAALLHLQNDFMR